MKGLREAVKTLHLIDRDAVIKSGALAYRMGIEQRDNPKKIDSERQLWDIGWTKARETFQTLLKRNEGTMR